MSDKPVVKGPVDGNIFAIMGAASQVLKRAGMKKEAVEMLEKVTQAHSYDQALAIIQEYVEFDLGED